MVVSDEISKIKGVGPKTTEQLHSADIVTVRDLLLFFPRRYEDYSHITTIASIQPGKVSLQGHFEHIHTKRVRRNMTITEATLVDATGKVAVVWFNQSYRVAQIEGGNEFLVSGEFGLQRTKYQIVNPAVESVDREAKSGGRIVPIYREVKGLKSTVVRKLLFELRPVMLSLAETLPPDLVKREKLMEYAEAIHALHFPEDAKQLDQAKDRMGFEELLALLLASLQNRADNDALVSHEIAFSAKDAQDFVQRLPFSLTNAQRIAAWEAIQNLASGTPMNRLLQGDVGSGKTVVAGLVAHIAAKAGFQTAFMAPTELLARQHAETLQNLLAPFETSVVLLTGSVKGKARASLYTHIASGEVKVVVGTHALIQQTVQFHNLGFVVIDEQHRFGVEQRQKLLAKSSRMPHLLAMTATPIPRSLQLTIYGELDISILNEKPKNRLPIQTDIVSPNSRTQMYEKVEREIAAGHQVYVICPLISDSPLASYASLRSSLDAGPVVRSAPSSEKSREIFREAGAAPPDVTHLSLIEKKSVEAEVKRLRQGVFKHRNIGLLHGKMKADEKQAAMLDFASGQTDILVSTTVVEVGVDVPNATVIIIEGADSFGLAQLHQLRGRVGRSELQSYCYLVNSDSKAPSRRLRELERSNDGFYLAERDLELRGPGEIYGRAQHGDLNLSFARITDTQQLARVKKAAEWLMQQPIDATQYPQLAGAVLRYRRLTTLN